ncbi:hypothetical protein [Clostridium felsineum]|uniref:hypothetical protein n=1 Tax=Clostridium felsineum TaxID=36839 RepID=UPI00098C733C|nr:hypothetical protein [Clostridium felsineum]URZ16867.1 hypothetical protein CLFE_029140 [Clostridium felsineum DSM 794]
MPEPINEPVATNEPTATPPVTEPVVTPKAEPGKVEPVKEPTVEPTEPTKPDTTNNNDLEALKAEIERLKQIEAEKSNLEQTIGNLQKDLEALKTNSNNSVKEYEAVMNKMLEAQVKDIPENMRALIPENMTPSEKIDWINKAHELGLFKGTQTEPNPNIQIGKALNPATGTQGKEVNGLSASTIIAMGYSNTKK